MLNDFNIHRKNKNSDIKNIINEEENLDILNNNMESIDETFKSNQINLSNN